MAVGLLVTDVGAGCVALALEGPERPADWLNQVAEWVAVIDEPFGSYISQLREWKNLRPEDAVVAISRSGVGPGHQDSWEGISPFVVGSVLWSLYSFFRSPDDYTETVRTAIAVGCDVDTTAAMAGAISGTYLGLGAIENRLSFATAG